MTAGAGVVRSAASLARASAALEEVHATLRRAADTGTGHDELRNLLTVGFALLASASAREESRGAHTRSDFPATDPAWRCRLVHAGPSGRD